MKIVFFSADKDNQSASFKEVFLGLEVQFEQEVLNEHTVARAADADIVCVFVDSTVSREVIDALPNLKLITTRSVGYNQIDVEYAKQKGIAVANVPGYGSHTVAEFAFGLLLTLSRKLYIAGKYVKDTLDFNYNSTMQGFDLRGLVLGVIGTGRIGKNVIQIAKGFGMKVVAYDPFPDSDYAQKLDFSYKSLDEVLGEADVITLHAPYTKENFHLIDKEKIAKMKKGVCLVNTARGELIDTRALVWGLKKGIVASAGLDVLEEENLYKKGEKTEMWKLNRELMGMENVIITPHTAFYSREAISEIAKITIDNVNGFLNGVPKNLV